MLHALCKNAWYVWIPKQSISGAFQRITLPQSHLTFKASFARRRNFFGWFCRQARTGRASRFCCSQPPKYISPDHAQCPASTRSMIYVFWLLLMRSHIHDHRSQIQIISLIYHLSTFAILDKYLMNIQALLQGNHLCTNEHFFRLVRSFLSKNISINSAQNLHTLHQRMNLISR